MVGKKNERLGTGMSLKVKSLWFISRLFKSLVLSRYNYCHQSLLNRILLHSFLSSLISFLLSFLRFLCFLLSLSMPFLSLLLFLRLVLSIYSLSMFFSRLSPYLFMYFYLSKLVSFLFINSSHLFSSEVNLLYSFNSV